MELTLNKSKEVLHQVQNLPQTHLKLTSNSYRHPLCQTPYIKPHLDTTLTSSIFPSTRIQIQTMAFNKDTTYTLCKHVVKERRHDIFGPERNFWIRIQHWEILGSKRTVVGYCPHCQALLNAGVHPRNLKEPEDSDDPQDPKNPKGTSDVKGEKGVKTEILKGDKERADKDTKTKGSASIGRAVEYDRNFDWSQYGILPEARDFAYD